MLHQDLLGWRKNSNSTVLQTHEAFLPPFLYYLLLFWGSLCLVQLFPVFTLNLTLCFPPTKHLVLDFNEMSVINLCTASHPKQNTWATWKVLISFNLFVTLKSGKAKSLHKTSLQIWPQEQPPKECFSEYRSNAWPSDSQSDTSANIRNVLDTLQLLPCPRGILQKSLDPRYYLNYGGRSLQNVNSPRGLHAVVTTQSYIFCCHLRVWRTPSNVTTHTMPASSSRPELDISLCTSPFAILPGDLTPSPGAHMVFRWQQSQSSFQW